jgi:TRAP-type transport system periplasmic protein
VNRRLPVLLVLLTAMVASVFSQTLNFKLGVSAPKNSSWGMALDRMAADWKKISGGKVNLTVYAGTLGDDNSIIQKMRFGLDAGVFPSTGLSLIYEDILALSIPSLVRNDTELKAVLAEMDGAMRAEMGKKGYTVITYASGGWIKLFSRRPIAKPSDIVNLKVAVPVDDVKMSRMLQAAGAVPVQSSSTNLVGQIATGAIDALLISPSFVQAQWSFFKSYLPYVSDLRISPFVGAILMNTKSWERVPQDLRKPLMDSADRMASNLSREADRLDDVAIKAMTSDGLTVVPLTAADRAAWYDVFVANRERFVRGLFSKEILDAIDRVVRARSGRP